MKIIQELYDLKTVCVGGMQIWIFWILENCWNYKKIIEFSQESTILGKLQWSCGKLEPNASSICPDKKFFVLDKIEFVQDKNICPLDKKIVKENFCFVLDKR